MESKGWHYNDDAATYGPLTCQYIFVLDSLNFCFWEVPGLEYDTLAIALRDAMKNDSSCFSAERLSSITKVWLTVNALQSIFNIIFLLGGNISSISRG